MIAKIITDGTHQFIQLPKGFEMTLGEVSITPHDGGFVVMPKADSWQKLHQALALFEPDLVLERPAQGE